MKCIALIKTTDTSSSSARLQIENAGEGSAGKVVNARGNTILRWLPEVALNNYAPTRWLVMIISVVL